ncbi:Nif-specific regulatory protein [Oxalicibacterium faecigallinarum]|uniref:Nif-specific regulatory protein n=3 Tax=Oxalicibacterium faecigallinarum TaxID=573741 RepID=A0A8J3ARJ6_9BURK|nr:Nif-specific regulatory protein [Oxalicibacterium faecigallinarum]
MVAQARQEGRRSLAQRSTAKAELQRNVHGIVDWSQAQLFVTQEISKLIGKSLDPAFAISNMLQLLSEFLGLNRGRLFLFDAQKQRLVIRYSYGLAAEEIARGVFRPGEGITGKVFQSGEVAIIQDIDAEPNYLARTVDRDRLPKGIISMFALPIIVDGTVRGVLAINRFRGLHRPLSDDLVTVRLVAAQIAQLMRIENLVNEQVERRTAALTVENLELKKALGQQAQAGGIIGESMASRAALHQIMQVARTVATVLLLGESGTGKELFARALHTASDRRDAPFVKVNCGAIPENLFESELFGHEKGSFTGAHAAKPGRFEDADGGTLFLDEVGDLPLLMQVKLLRALQEQQIQRVGGRREIPVNVRIVAATNRDLQKLVASGRFRLDLFYRLNVVPVHLPALRARPEDIPALARHFLSLANGTFQRQAILGPGALDQLVRFPWPGNIRQLQNIVERLVLLAERQEIEAADVRAVLQSERTADTMLAGMPVDAPQTRSIRPVREDERANIVEALEECGGNKSRTAQRLGLTLRQLNYRIKVLEIAV